ncbi:MAG: hypothetical protein JWP12_91 [Bacteroidetes bacterium]|nr:hypothetical protein [Bacteroidota bacterium]
MKISDLKKASQENTPAIVTSIIVFLLVGLYMAFIVPANVDKEDAYNKSTLQEFNLQFNNILKDFANQVDIDNLKDSLVKKAGQLYPFCDKKCDKDSTLLKLLHKLQSDSCRNSPELTDIIKNGIIQSVQIESVTTTGSELIIHKKINLQLSNISKDDLNAKDSKILARFCSITDTACVNIGELKTRLSGAIAFKNWAIYSGDSSRRILINQSIEKEELDSVRSKTSKSGILLFKFSDKRFYRQSVTVDATNNVYILVGAISQANFDQQSKRVDLNRILITALMVILLLLTIPMIKPLISSKKERLTQFDLLNTTSAIGVLALVLVSFSFTIFLSDNYQRISTANLMTLNKQVQTKLDKEFEPYFNVFNIVKKELTPDSALPVHYNIESFYKRPAIADLLNTKNINNLQNFFTINSKGELIKDISRENDFNIRMNFKERDYFQVLKDKGYSKMITAVFSKYDNQLKFVFVQKNPITVTNTLTKKTDTVDFYLTGFAFKPEFTDEFKHNVNNGYILCNNTGRVILNSDIDKSLHEDIYANSNNNYDLSQMLHNMKDTTFEFNYNGDPCLFYAKNYTSNIRSTVVDTSKKNHVFQANLNDYPLYLLSYKKQGFTNSLQIYTIINGFILSVGYVLAIMLLVLLYSIFFFMGDVSVFSRYHLFWLYPDNSRRKEYIVLMCINYGLFITFLVLCITGYKHVLYLSILSGINLAFLNFVLLNQRVFLFKKSEKNTALTKNRRRYSILLVITIASFSYLFPWMLYMHHLPSFGLSLSFAGHFLILYALKKDTKKIALPKNAVTSAKSCRPAFISYFLSVISYHYILVPMLIISYLFLSEVNTVKDLNNSYFKKEELATKSDPPQQQYFLKKDGNMSSLLPVAPPSKKYLEETRFDYFKHNMYDFKIYNDFIATNSTTYSIFMLLLSLVITVLLICNLINYYSGRFFFYELSEAYRLGYFKPDKLAAEFTNTSLIMPPYSEHDLQELERTEKPNTEITGSLDDIEKSDSKVWLKGIKNNIVSNKVKMELIMMNHFETYRDQYLELWDELTEEEKFVMSDFATDTFVNYKNRNVVIGIMKKGQIIADPLTGRLRVMNYGYRNFIVYLDDNVPESAKAIKEKEETSEALYSKWKLPLMIIAISGIVIFMYLSQESFNQVLLLGGSAISAIGLIARFLNTYKQS